MREEGNGGRRERGTATVRGELTTVVGSCHGGANGGSRPSELERR